MTGLSSTAGALAGVRHPHAGSVSSEPSFTLVVACRGLPFTVRTTEKGTAMAGTRPMIDNDILTTLRRRGRPTLGYSTPQGIGRSPVRQARLPEDLNQRLDDYVLRHGGNSSKVIRDAVAEYLDRVGA